MFVNNVNIDSNIGMSIIQHQAIIQIKDNFCQMAPSNTLIWLEISMFSIKIVHLKLLSSKSWPSFLEPRG